MNIKSIVLVLALSLCSVQGFGQESGLDFSGYLENTLTAESNKAIKKTTILNETRVRLNIANQYQDKGDFSVAIIGTQYGGKKNVNLCDYLPEEEASKFTSPVEINRTNDIWFQEAYGSLYVDDFQIRVGRQKYYTGTGYAWNPTDLFNWKNALDPTYEIEGLDSLHLAQTFLEDSKVTLYYSFGTSHNRPEREYIALEDGDYQVKIKTLLSSWEVAVQYSDVRRDFVDYDGLFSGTVSMVDMVRKVKWQLIGAEISGDIKGVGIHAEGGSVTLTSYDSEDRLPDTLKNHQKYLVGVDYTFENGWYLIFEYYHEGLGENSEEDYRLNQRMAYLSGETDSIGRDNYFLGSSYPITDFSTLALYTIVNGSDGSVIINPWWTWVAADDITVSVSAQIPNGGEKTAIGRSGAVAFARINFSL